MIENEININGRFSLRVNFNLVMKKGSKAQIWLTTTINRQRVRIYTGLRIEPEYWIRAERNQVGERAIVDGNISAVQKRANKAKTLVIMPDGYQTDAGRISAAKNQDIGPNVLVTTAVIIERAMVTAVFPLSDPFD